MRIEAEELVEEELSCLCFSKSRFVRQKKEVAAEEDFCFSM